MAAVAVPWVDDRDAQVALPAEQLLLEGGLEAVDPRRGDVFRAAAIDDRVFEVGAVERGFQSAAVSQLAAPLQFVAL
ncbi:hypothetical protein D3C81_2164110 [compost metagenome]